MPEYCRRGFSIMEILVAVSLLAVIIVALLAMFNQTQRAFRQSATQVDLLEAGRITLGLLSREIQEMTAFGNSNVVNTYTKTGVRSEQDLPGGEKQKNTLQDFYFLSRVNDQWIERGYYVSLRNDFVGTLYKFEKRSHHGDAPFSFAFRTFTNAVELSAKTGVVDTNFLPIADGVLDFRFQAFDASGFPYTNSPPLFDPYDPADGFAFIERFVPAYLEMNLAILEPATLRQFYALPTGSSAAQAFLNQNVGKVHTFRQRIPIRNHHEP